MSSIIVEQKEMFTATYNEYLLELTHDEFNEWEVWIRPTKEHTKKLFLTKAPKNFSAQQAALKAMDALDKDYHQIKAFFLPDA